MAYNPTTWNTGDTITASALNKIEQGIAGVADIAVVKVEWTDVDSSYGCLVGTTDGLVGDMYSLNTYFQECLGGGYHPVQYLLVPLPSDGNQAVVFFSDYWHEELGVMSGSGGVSSTPTVGYIRTGNASWNSLPYWAFVVTGNGTITLSYND